MNLDSLFQGDLALISEENLNLLMNKTLQLLPRFVPILMEDGCLRPLSVAMYACLVLYFRQSYTMVGKEKSLMICKMVGAVKDIPDILSGFEISNHNAVRFLLSCSDRLSGIFDIQRVQDQTFDNSKLEVVGSTLDNLVVQQSRNEVSLSRLVADMKLQSSQTAQLTEQLAHMRHENSELKVQIVILYHLCTIYHLTSSD